MASHGPYHGLKVLDFSHVIAGPFCTHLLADLGADVIKVEPPHGDMLRRLPITYAEDLSSAFAQYNCGKRSIAVDLKSEDGRQIVRGLARDADVVVENFAPGTMAAFGLSYEDLVRENPETILCSLSSFGATGPYSTISGFGLLAEAYSGLMDLAAADDAGPTFFGTPLADMNSGVHALAAIGAALFRRGVTGKGTHLDISSFDALVAMIDQAVALGSFTGGQQQFGRFGNRHSMTVPSGVAKTADGQHVAYGAPGDAYFAKLVAAMGQPDLAKDERYATAEARVEHKDEVYGRIESWAATIKSADELVSILAEHGIAAARVRSVEETMTDPHLIERGALAPVDIDPVGEVLLQTAPYRMLDVDIGPSGPPPRIGEHTIDVLRHELHLDEAAIEDLISRSVVMVPRSGEGPHGEEITHRTA